MKTNLKQFVENLLRDEAYGDLIYDSLCFIPNITQNRVNGLQMKRKSFELLWQTLVLSANMKTTMVVRVRVMTIGQFIPLLVATKKFTYNSTAGMHHITGLNSPNGSSLSLKKR